MDGELADRVARAAAALKQIGATEVYLFGSATGGRLGPHSDIDLAVSGLPPGLFFRAMSIAWDIVERPVDLLDLDDPTPLVAYLRASGTLRRVG